MITPVRDQFLCFDGESFFCADCKGSVPDEDFLTEVNPPGGYGRPQVLICDACMKSGRWEHWKSRHWANWPEPRV